MAAGHDASSLLNAGAIDETIKLLSTSRDGGVTEQAIWFLGNIAGDSASNRDYVLGRGVMDAILRIDIQRGTTSLQRNIAWTLSNLCRGKPAPGFQFVSAAIPTLANLIFSNDDGNNKP